MNLTIEKKGTDEQSKNQERILFLSDWSETSSLLVREIQTKSSSIALKVSEGKMLQASSLLEELLSTVRGYLEVIGSLEKKIDWLSGQLDENIMFALEQRIQESMKGALIVLAESKLILGSFRIKEGHWQKGLEALRLAHDLFRHLNDYDGMARAFIEIGTVQELFGDYELAKLSFLDAERLFKKTKREEGIAVAELQLGTLALDHYDYEQARPHLQFASKFFHQHGDQERAKLSDDFLKLADEFERDLALV